MGPEVSGILGHLVGAPDEAIRTDVPHRPEVWGDLCGRYSLRGSWRDVDKWVIAGAEVVVRGGRLVLRPEPVISGLRGFPLSPDDEGDPYVFRVDLSRLGIGIVRVVFSAETGAPATAFHLEMEPLMSFDKRPPLTDPKLWTIGAFAAGAAVVAARRVSSREGTSS